MVWVGYQPGGWSPTGLTSIDWSPAGWSEILLAGVVWLQCRPTGPPSWPSETWGPNSRIVATMTVAMWKMTMTTMLTKIYNIDNVHQNMSNNNKDDDVDLKVLTKQCRQ